ncbi:Hypothetical predicted protein [Olea europaea subsp. europaea]|uniref:Uncharacterized protein n=1 Tax=Olea europaea subsp. europaea TaxID=158383 RepID=A0A8S0VMX0_OLEEU|nr:Hypothetical predicted protein [Olea europaea subsp. europaea]
MSDADTAAIALLDRKQSTSENEARRVGNMEVLTVAAHKEDRHHILAPIATTDWPLLPLQSRPLSPTQPRPLIRPTLEPITSAPEAAKNSARGHHNHNLNLGYKRRRCFGEQHCPRFGLYDLGLL